VKSDSQWGSGHISTAYHDFGSILSFIEQVYGLGNISPNYEYADFFAPDNNNPGGPLGDFFCYPPTCQARSFSAISLQYAPPGSCTASAPPYGCGATQCNIQVQNGQQCVCSASCFINYPGGARDADTN
jgi:hypothetical protein